MESGKFRSKLARVWDAFWSAGISSPFEVTEQITYLMYIRHLEDVQEAKERKAARSGAQVEDPVYTSETYHLRWSQFARKTPQRMLAVVREEVFPWLRSQVGKQGTYSRHLGDARFIISTPNLLGKVVDLLNEVPLAERDAWRTVYEYMLGRISDAGWGGQVLTPRHVVQLIVEMMAPSFEDEICDPACGGARLLTASAEYMARTHGLTLRRAAQDRRISDARFHGYDFDSTMLRVASMSMMLHEIENPDVRYRDSLAEDADEDRERYSLVMSNPPFGGVLDDEAIADDLRASLRTKKTELLFLARIIRLLRRGGRAAVVVPEGMLFGSTNAHRELRRRLVEDNGLDAVVKLPRGTFKPYAGVSAVILVFAKAGETDHVWFYEVTADGWSLDNKRVPLLDEDKLGPVPRIALAEAEHTKNNLPDLLARWRQRKSSERRRRRSDQSFCVAKADIIAQEYDLSIQRHRQTQEVERVVGGEAWRLGDVAEVFAGWVPSKEIDEASDSHRASNEASVLRVAALKTSLPDVSRLPVRTSERRPPHRLRAGDLVGRALVGGTWYVLPSEYDGIQAERGLLVIRITRHVLPPEYLAMYLSSTQAEVYFAKYSTSFPMLHPRGLADLSVPVCDGGPGWISAAIERLGEGFGEASQIQRRLHQSKENVFDNCTSGERRIRLERAADLSSLIAQNLRKQAEPYRLFQEAYPYAVARAVRRFIHSPSLTEKHEAAVQCAESLILSLGILALAIAARAGWRSRADIAKWALSVERGGVALGHWVGVIRATGALAREGGDEAAGLAEATVPGTGGKGLIADLDTLVALRNRIRHGAGPRTKAEMEKSLANLEQLTFSALSSSTFLARARWIHTSRLHWLPKAGRYKISGLALMGDHPDFEPVEVETDLPVPDNELYLFTRNGEIIPLSPFCVLDDCPTCLAPELYYTDRLTRSTAVLKSLDRGHVLESDEVFEAVRSWVSQ